MSILSKLFTRSSKPESQAVLVYLDGTSLPESVYEEYDLATIEDLLTDVIEKNGLGEYDGNERGETETTLFMYGPDAERLFSAIEATLRAYPLCQNARVIIRRGGPGGPEREIRLPLRRNNEAVRR